MDTSKLKKRLAYVLGLTIILWCTFVSTSAFSQEYFVQIQDSKPGVTLRGISVVDSRNAWVSGSKGYIAISVDSAKTWNWNIVKGHENNDFRFIKAFSENSAIIASSGNPAVILKTENGGKTWSSCYENSDSLFFINAIRFQNRLYGYAVCNQDANSGLFRVLATYNGGNTWEKVNVKDTTNIALTLGETIFSSGKSSLGIGADSTLFVVTGGYNSRLFSSIDSGQTWTATTIPITHGTFSKGAYAIEFDNIKNAIIVGGDRENDIYFDQISCFSHDNGKTWTNSTSYPSGFKSSASYIAGKIFIATGPEGTDISSDLGENWERISDEGFHSCSSSPDGKLTLLVGHRGRIAKLIIIQ